MFECVCVVVFVKMKERRDYISWKVAEDEKEAVEEVYREFKGVESQESIWESCDWDKRWRPFSSGLRGLLPRSGPTVYAPGGGRLRKWVAMEIKGSSSKLWYWRGEKGAEISPRNSTLYVEEGEGDRGETSGSKHGETGEGESKIKEGESIKEDMGEDTGSYLEGEENLFSDMEEEVCGEEGEGKQEEGLLMIPLLSQVVY